MLHRFFLLLGHWEDENDDDDDEDEKEEEGKAKGEWWGKQGGGGGDRVGSCKKKMISSQEQTSFTDIKEVKHKFVSYSHERTKRANLSLYRKWRHIVEVKLKVNGQVYPQIRSPVSIQYEPGWTNSQSGHFGEEKSFCPWWNSNPRSSSWYLVTILTTMLSWLHMQAIESTVTCHIYWILNTCGVNHLLLHRTDTNRRHWPHII